MVSLQCGMYYANSVQSLSHIPLFATPWTEACQASLSIANSWSLFKLKSIKSWCHPTISSSVIPSSCLQSFPPSGSFQMSQFFASGGLSIGVSASASVLPMSIQDWFPLGWTMLSILQALLYIALTKKCVREILSLLHRGINWGAERLNGHTLNLFNRD